MDFVCFDLIACVEMWWGLAIHGSSYRVPWANCAGNSRVGSCSQQVYSSDSPNHEYPFAKKKVSHNHNLTIPLQSYSMM